MDPKPLPLTVLDLVPIAAGSSVAGAVANSVDLARRTEAAGYRRYWIAEHHLNPGVVSSSPVLVISLVAAATSRIRVGSGAVLFGHQTPLTVVEQFGLLDALHPGRIDLGLGRSGSRRPPGALASEKRPGRVTERGLVIPAPPPIDALLSSPRVALQSRMLQQPGAETPPYAEQVGDVVALLCGEYRSAEGHEAHAMPGEGAAVEVWILGSSAGESAEVAGALGLPFGANYHVSPASILDAVSAYRSSFRPSGARTEPYVLVSADVGVGPDDATARELASPYALWVRSIRSGQGAIEFPSPADAARHEWCDEDRALVADRLATQFVGSPSSVAAKLRILAEETGADELMITTITHRHADRVRSYELLAREWGISD